MSVLPSKLVFVILAACLIIIGTALSFAGLFRSATQIEGWKHYKNSKGQYKYSFVYPEDWVISDCGDGEIVVANRPIEICYMPLDAPQDYIDSLYFQIFMPARTQAYFLHYCPDFTKLSRLENWSSLVWHDTGYEFSFHPDYIADPITFIPVSHGYTNTNNCFGPDNLVWLGIGYYSNSSYDSLLKRVFASFQFHAF